MKLTDHLSFIAGVVVFVTTFVILRASPIHQVADSKYAIVSSQELLARGSFSLKPETFPALAGKSIDDRLIRGETLHYQLEQVGGRLFYYFPPGTALLSMPYVAVMNALGVYAVDAKGVYDEPGETTIQAGLAAWLMAGLAVFVFATSQLLLPIGWSAVIAVGTALGTQVYSTASRALWTETWGIFILSIVLWLVVRAETKQVRHRPVLLATCMAWLYFVRPTFSIPIVAITLYLLIYHRALFIPYALTGSAWLAAFIAYSLAHFGQILPNYYGATRLSFVEFWEAIAGNLVSPSRGLLVYIPVLVFVIYLLLRYRKTIAWPRFVVLSLAVIVLHLIAVSGFVPWFGGQCYGPRYSTSLVPFFALLGILAVQARLRARDTDPNDSKIRGRAEWSVGAVLLLCSVIFNGVGAISPHSNWWNAAPISVDAKPARVWDWNDPQFLRPWQSQKSFETLSP